jgi:hypothetical protein
MPTCPSQCIKLFGDPYSRFWRYINNQHTCLVDLTPCDIEIDPVNANTETDLVNLSASDDKFAHRGDVINHFFSSKYDE